MFRVVKKPWPSLPLTIPLPLFATSSATGPHVAASGGLSPVNLRRSFSSLAGVLALAVPVMALATPLIALDSAVYVEKVSPDKSRTLQPAARLNHGDRVVFVVSWYRMGGTGAFTVTNPLPRSVYFQGSADGSEEVSLDGGKSWGKLEHLRIGDRHATPEDVTQVRWHVPATEAARGAGEITYSAIVR